MNSNAKKEVSLIERILLLHYFLHASGQPLANKQISYKELSGEIFISNHLPKDALGLGP